jgi:formylglycine-generating enzyme required for sulfatase activity
MDIAGNVWEWCLNKYDHSEHTTPDQSGDSRVLRGGSWFYNPERARTFVRENGFPGSRSRNTGFRILYSARPSYRFF